MHIMTKRGWKPLKVRYIHRPIYVKSLLEENGLLPAPPPGEKTVVDQYCDAVYRFSLPMGHPNGISESQCFAILSMRNVNGASVPPSPKRPVAAHDPKWDDGKPRLSEDLWWKNQIRY